MKPTRTSHILRSILGALKSEERVCALGYPSSHSPLMPDPLSFTCHKKFSLAYQQYNVIRKRELEKPSSTQIRNSLGKWADSEWRCHVVNTTGWWVQPIERSERVRLDALFQRVRTIISEILMDQWPDLDFCPTGGATATVSRQFSVASSKVDGTPLTAEPQPHKCAPASRDYLELMFEENPGVARRFLRARDRLLDESQVVEPIEMPSSVSPDDLADLANHLCTNVPPAKFDWVPKDWDSVRLIGKSNSISIMVQKTFGTALRKALLKVGINLNDQSINQEWAEIGSITGLVATVDLSAASDSISLACLSLFPRRWREYFLSCRDTHVAVKSTTHKLAMIAGMGNGYIFELESLLFYAMTKAVVEECNLNTSWISVYGDDIICPVGAVDRLEEVFLACGFLLNKTKSFKEGKFRESCGKHYFNGFDVTPWYVKSNLDDISELYHHYNGLSEWSDRTGHSIESCLRQIVNCIPPRDRCMVPVTWSTKSGLHYPCEGALHPVRKWNRNLQRFEYVWNVLVQRNSVEAFERLPERIQIVDRLLSYESTEVLCDPVYFCRALLRRSLADSHVVYNARINLINSLHGNIYVSGKPTFGWSLTDHRTKHRGEIL